MAEPDSDQAEADLSQATQAVPARAESLTDQAKTQDEAGETTPATAEPAETGTASVEPTLPEPIDAEIIDAELVEPEDATKTETPAESPTDVVDAEVLDTAPIHPAPVEPQPTETEPVDAELIDAEPTESTPAEAPSAPTEPIDAELIETTPTAVTTPTDAGPIDAKPADSEPADTKSANPENPTTTAQRTEEPAATAAPEPVKAEPAKEDAKAKAAEPVEAPHQTQPQPAQQTTPRQETAPRPRTGNAALRTPSMQLPTVNVAPPPQPILEPERRRADPEQILATYPWKVDPVTLRETADDPEPLLAVRDRLTDKLEYAERDAIRARLLSLRAVVSRVLGDLGRALADARDALRHAEAAGDLRQIVLVQARLAHVQQWRGDFAEADRLFEEINSVELPDRLRAELHVHAGLSGYEQGRYLEACNHFEAALELRRVEDPGLVARTETALDAVMARVREAGWGPYPRSREEILQRSRPPHPALDYDSGWQGYADSDGEVVIPERYAEVQPFHEGVAWVRRPGTAAWELIDETGGLVIDPSSGYVQVGRFSGGLAWVSREPAGGWFAVDWHNRVIVPGGFEDVRPFRHGLAVVRRGGWGAIDRHGRVAVQFRYQRFATELTAGGPVAGFTADGLAVIDAGDRLGVVNRGGQLLVAPVHSRLLIHPLAFLVGDRDGHWGALDRNGDPIVEVTRERPGDVVDEIERLLSGTRTVL
ncbi:hypothetical protein DMB66_28425 [Actinoplanes sp. ATCC 53533]|nr:hypothetical protein DMB66_28425 [Actinoplanes sp. ATCC 53533]